MAINMICLEKNNAYDLPLSNSAYSAGVTPMFSSVNHKNIYQMIALLGLISAGLLAGALAFQYLGGLMPCKLCIWQRWPHAVIILLSILGLLALRPKLVFTLIILASLTNAGLAGYHAGVEWGFWSGPSSCSGLVDSSLSASAVLDQLLQTPVVRCDEVVWSLFGLSMAGWNFLFSLLQAFLAGKFWRI